MLKSNNINVDNFTKDLAEGEDFQDKVLKSIQKKYPKAHVIEGYHKEFDILIPEIDESVEAKYDRRCDETHNYFIEYSFNGKPSGIAVTKADWYIIGSYMWWCWIEVDEMKEALRGKVEPWGKKFEGKDGTVVEGLVVPMQFVWDLPSTKKIRHPSYEEIWEDMGYPEDFTTDDMKYVDSIL